MCCLIVCVFNSHALCAHLQHVKEQCVKSERQWKEKPNITEAAIPIEPCSNACMCICRRLQSDNNNNSDDSHINPLLNANVLVEFLVFFSFHSFSRSLRHRRRRRRHHHRRFVFLYVFLATIPFKANHDRINCV